MPKEIIVDTSALIAFFVKSETNHLKAKEFVLNHQDNGWIILETVFDETVTWVRTRISSSASICSILVMANRLKVPKVFAFDEHIRQMSGLGIICVPD